MDFKETRLYGGAITCRVPSKFEDLSELVPVSDNQEVFVYHFNQGSSSTSTPSGYDFVLSFEIFQYLVGLDELSSGGRLFEDLASCNEARNSRILTCSVTPSVNLCTSHSFPTVSVSGTMEVSRDKFNRDGYEEIRVLLYNVRMPNYGCEFMVSYSYPVASAVSQREHESAFEEVVRTLRVVDPNLFVT